MALVSLRRMADRTAVQTLVRWRTAVLAAASPDNPKEPDPSSVRSWADELGLEFGVDCFESDVATCERVARLQAGVALLEAGIESDLKPYKTLDNLRAAITKARDELQRLEAVESGIASQQLALGYEKTAVAQAKADAPRVFNGD